MMVTSINVDNFDTPLECLSRCVNIATKHFSSSRQGQFVNLLWFLLAIILYYLMLSHLLLELVLGNRTPSLMQRRCKSVIHFNYCTNQIQSLFDKRRIMIMMPIISIIKVKDCGEY